MNSMNLSDENRSNLVNMAAGKLGKSPESIKQALESGDMESLKAGLDPKAAARLNQVLSDPKQLEAILGNKQLMQLLGLMGK